MNESEMRNEVDAILTDNVNSRNRIQTLLKEMAIHTDKHGNVTPFMYFADRLASDEAKGLNIRAIGDWINAFTKCNIQYDAKAKKHVASYSHNKVTQLSGKGYKPWYEFKASTLSEEYSLTSEIQRTISSANKKMRLHKKLIDAGDFAGAAKIVVDHNQLKLLKLVVNNPSAIVIPDEPESEDMVEVIPASTAAAS